MPYYASLAGVRVTAARILIPPWGAAAGDADLDTDAPLPAGVLPLVIGNLTLAMSVFRGGPFAGSRSVRLVAGAGGWGRDVGARFYRDAGGVKLSAIARDAAGEVGETVLVPADRLVGEFFAREFAPASRVLTQLVGLRGWHIDAAGVTRLAERSASRITTDFSAKLNPAAGHVEVATEDLASWVPGAVFASATIPTARTVSSVTIAMYEDGRLRLEVLT